MRRLNKAVMNVTDFVLVMPISSKLRSRLQQMTVKTKKTKISYMYWDPSQSLCCVIYLETSPCTENRLLRYLTSVSELSAHPIC